MLREAVQSVLEQTHRPVEIIVVDDGSTDETSDVTDDLSRTYEEVLVIHQAKTGPGLARESGRVVAKGDFIQYLDSDDLLLPHKFEVQVTGLQAHPECGVAYGKTRFYRIGETPSDIPLKLTGEKISTMFPSFLKSRWWSTSTPLYRRELLDRAGPWENLRIEEDWEYDCRIASFGVKLCYCDIFISETRGHPNARLNREGSANPERLRDKARAHELIYSHARNAGIDHETHEMKHFARELFLLSRQCGAIGFAHESQRLFALAREASGRRRGAGLDFKCYDFAAKIFGWSNAGYIACKLNKYRGRV
jgi:glycosyltransferase involved in cell wall biosynthesis